MRLIKLSAMQLQPGMFIAELDRPWVETPFSIQGFVVRNDEEVFYIAEHVEHVYVDADYHGSPTYLPVQLMDREGVSRKISIKTEFQQAKASFETATETLDKVISDLSKGKQADIKAVRQTVQPLIDGVFRNKEALAALVRLKDAGDYRFNHGIAMSVWAAILGRHIGLHRDELEKLVIGCVMCDVGMTTLPKSVLDNPGSLSNPERQTLRSHPVAGAKMVENADEMDLEVLAIIENHHERFDGSGYPRGVEGASIPLLARIAGLVDSYDAMITAKPYARGKSSFEASQELIESKDRLFQGVLVEQFIQAIGLFPTGALVELNTGEVAIVVSQNESRRLKPEIVVILNARKEKCETLELVDLAHADVAERRWISAELQPGAYDVDCEEYFL